MATLLMLLLENEHLWILEGRIRNGIFVLDSISNKDNVIREDLLSPRPFQHMHG